FLGQLRKRSHGACLLEGRTTSRNSMRAAAETQCRKALPKKRRPEFSSLNKCWSFERLKAPDTFFGQSRLSAGAAFNAVAQLGNLLLAQGFGGVRVEVAGPVQNVVQHDKGRAPHLHVTSFARLQQGRNGC